MGGNHDADRDYAPDRQADRQAAQVGGRARPLRTHQHERLEALAKDLKANAQMERKRGELHLHKHDDPEWGESDD
jgi:hypothetical protein